MFKNICVLMLCVLVWSACGKKKKTMTGEEPVNVEEFVAFYPELNLPVTYSDSLLLKKDNDSFLVSREIYSQFVPDSILTKTFAKAQPKLYVVGKYGDKNGDTYLITKAVANRLNALYIAAFSKKYEYLGALEALRSNQLRGVSNTIIIDPLLNINKKTVQKLSNDIEISGDDVYVLNKAAKNFMLIMTDSLGDLTELINPIDTLGRAFKYAADYGTGNRNIISIRDDKREGRLQFFIHLEAENSECSGELKGLLTITGSNTAEYRQAGDPCKLQFLFDKNHITLKEIEGCGSRMGALNCSFDGVYPKKKVVGKTEN